MNAATQSCTGKGEGEALTGEGIDHGDVVKRVLVVEDNPGDAEFARQVLCEQGYRVEVAHSLKQALALLRRQGFDGIVLDTTLPDSGALDAVWRIHASTPRTPFVVFTTEEDADIASKCLRLGAQDYLVKGRDTPQLGRAVRHALERHYLLGRLFEASRQLAELAGTRGGKRYDPVTGLLSHAQLGYELARENARATRGETPFTAVVSWIDEFSALDSSLTETDADTLVGCVAERLRECLRETDIAGRLAGDQLVILLPNTGPAGAKSFAERFRESVSARPISVGERRMRVTVSLAVSPVPSTSRSIRQLLGDTFLGSVISSGAIENRVIHNAAETFVDPALRLRFRHGDGLSIHMQPIVELSSGRTVGCELLSRFQVPGLSRPADVFAFCEAWDILNEVDARCVERAAQSADGLPGTWRRHLNVFASTLRANATREMVTSLLNERAQWCIELSATDPVADATLAPVIETLRSQGITVALQDVGLDLRSLEQIIALRPDVVKVKATNHHPRPRHVYERLQNICSRVGSPLIATGVEDEATAAMLLEVGVPLGQGVHWGPPTPVSP